MPLLCKLALRLCKLACGSIAGKQIGNITSLIILSQQLVLKKLDYQRLAKRFNTTRCLAGNLM